MVRTLEGYPHTSAAVRLPSSIDQVVAPVGRPAKLGGSRALRAIVHHEAAADVYHLHGIWLRAMFYGYEKARRENRPYLIEINGALDPLELATKPWRKRLIRWWHQNRMLREAGCIHVNSVREAEHVRALGFRAPIAVIPAGFNFAEFDALAEQAKNVTPSWAEGLKGRRILLFLARIHPAKGIDDLLTAWMELAGVFPDLDLLVIGPGEAAEVAIRKAKVAAAGMEHRCHWAGMVSEVDRAWAYTHAELYVLPSHKENFGNTVQEALGSGTPVVTTTQTPWVDLEKWGCGWVCADTPQGLKEALAKSLAEAPTELKMRGQIGRKIILERFSLTQVVNAQLAVYGWLNGGPKPDCLWPN